MCFPYLSIKIYLHILIIIAYNILSLLSRELDRVLLFIKNILIFVTVLKNAPLEKRPQRRPRLRWEDRVKEDVEKVKPGDDWKELSLERESWRRICWTVWSK
jgi:hypothetical protein